jgi:hypothetical protein
LFYVIGNKPSDTVRINYFFYKNKIFQTMKKLLISEAQQPRSNRAATAQQPRSNRAATAQQPLNSGC